MAAPPHDASLELSVLGGLRVTSSGGALGPAAHQPRRIAIPALLAVAGEEGLSRDRILAFFWPDQDEASARNALKQALHALRRDLAARDLFLDGPTLRLNPSAIEVDLWRFDRAIADARWADAIQSYGGPLLNGVGSLGSADLDHWLDIERERAARRFASAVESAAAESIRAGDNERALEYWYRLAAIDPLDSRAAEAIARHLAGSGNRSAALQHLQSHVARVREELDLPADPAVAALMEQLGTPAGIARVSPPPMTPARGIGPMDGQSTHAAARTRRPRLWHLLAGGVAVAGVLLMASSQQEAAPTDEEPPTIVVLPFENLGESGDQYFADGLTDEVTDRLATIPGVRVISRKSASLYRGTTKTMAQIRRELGADYLLDGTVRWQKEPNGESRVRVTERLVRTSDDTQLWSSVHEEPLREVFDIQAAIATQVAQTLRVSLLEPRGRGDRRERNLEAHDFLLRARAAFARGSSERDLLAASQLYDRAIALDSSYAEAWAGLARADAELYWSYYDRTLERLQSVRRAAERAVRIDPQSRDAHLALGYYHYYGFLNYQEALRHFEIARRIAPADGDVIEAIAYVRRRQGLWDRAVQDLTDALAADPRSYAKAYVLGETHLKLGHYEEAKRQLEYAVSLDAGQPQGHAALALLHLNATGDVATARAAVIEGLRSSSGPAMVRAALVSSGALLRIFPRQFDDALRNVHASDFGAQTEMYHLGRAMVCESLHGRSRCRAHYDSARAILEPKAASRGDMLAYYHGTLALAHAGMGNAEAAAREGQRAVELLPVSRDASNGPNIALHLAQAYAMSGRTDKALAELRKLSAIPSFFTPRLVAIDPVWEKIRGEL